MTADDTTRTAQSGTTRRRFLIGAAGFAGGFSLVSVLEPSPARATPASMAAAIKKVVGQAALRKGKVTLDVPPIVENGNTVSLEATVESPMTLVDHVKAIHVFNEKNPQPNVISARIGPRAGQAKIATRIRLADSQKVIAIAEMSDGTFWTDEVDVIVTIAACLEDLP
jgi:sulfur-oxidizing protein SoxY